MQRQPQLPPVNPSREVAGPISSKVSASAKPRRRVRAHARGMAGRRMWTLAARKPGVIGAPRGRTTWDRTVARGHVLVDKFGIVIFVCVSPFFLRTALPGLVRGASCAGALPRRAIAPVFRLGFAWWPTSLVHVCRPTFGTTFRGFHHCLAF